MFKTIIAILAVVGSIAALPGRRALPSGTVTCGSNRYSVSQVVNAVDQGFDLHEEGKTLGSDEYPHQFFNDEGLDLFCSGSSWQEFPILESGSYTGGSPGADRVVFNTAGTYCAVITHTGASEENGFVSCKGD
ncbi:guanyl-specific ribonuclease C2 [Punctularia strigosozonata HHB-11173 SS5]|uniref:guanyl-specific ribonuclease C2 n=1 Tax=Punctularia strigosozonata (strain HHB-11173) TaxID=741275 RepID=UPI0004416D14|nr:guanyl-specific ribonuclease C2 [Punctularia strigosozonata HHB-11173 SS5]EIN12042.1 guanyl-specific ribonuclease C2 [Punctularia strigosozonata HHB-11173 SS5]